MCKQSHTILVTMPRYSAWSEISNQPSLPPRSFERSGQLRTSDSQSSSLPHHATSLHSHLDFGASPQAAHGHVPKKIESLGIDDLEDSDLLEDTPDEEDEDILLDEDGEEDFALGPPQDIHIPVEPEKNIFKIQSATLGVRSQMDISSEYKGEDGDDDDDGGEMLARLMKMNEGLRNGTPVEVVKGSIPSSPESQAASATRPEQAHASRNPPGPGSTSSASILTSDERK